jgi:hypothetical protein
MFRLVEQQPFVWRLLDGLRLAARGGSPPVFPLPPQCLGTVAFCTHPFFSPFSLDRGVQPSLFRCILEGPVAMIDHHRPSHYPGLFSDKPLPTWWANVSKGLMEVVLKPPVTTRRHSFWTSYSFCVGVVPRPLYPVDAR